MLFRSQIAKHSFALVVVTLFSLLILTLPAQAALNLNLTYYNHDTLYTKLNNTTDLTVSGGTAPYFAVTSNGNLKIERIPGSTDRFRITSVTPGKTVITVRDSKGVTATKEFAIANPGVSPGTTQIIVTDSAGARTQGNAVVSDKKPLTISAPNMMLKGGKDFLVINGGNPPYKVKTSEHLAIALFDKDSVGRYRYLMKAYAPGTATVTVQDSKGQTVTRNITVTDPVALTFPDFPEGTLRAISVGQTTRVIVSGGTAPYTVTADKPSAVTIQQQGPNQFTVTGREAGVIGINVRDQKGNTRSMSLTVRALPTLTVAGPSAMTVGQAGTLTLIGGAAPFTVTSSGSQVTLTRQDEKRFQIVAQSPGTATITVRDGKGTVKTLTITVSAPKPPAAPKLDAVASNNTIYLVPNAANRNFCVVTVRGGQGNYQVAASPAIVTITPQGKTATGSMAYTITAKARGATTLTITDQSGQRTNVTIRIL